VYTRNLIDYYSPVQKQSARKMEPRRQDLLLSSKMLFVFQTGPCLLVRYAITKLSHHMSHLIYAVFPPDRWANLDAIAMNEPVPTALLLFFLDCQSSAQHFSNPRTIQRMMFQLSPASTLPSQNERRNSKTIYLILQKP
jgi:hypothetical protein